MGAPASQTVERAVAAALGRVHYFPVGGYFSLRGSRQFLIQGARRLRSGGRCLDFGCGAGAPWKGVVEAYGQEWFGADVAPASPPKENFRLVADNVLDFPDAFFGAAFSIDVLEHLEHPEQSLAELARVLEPGAVFLGSCAFWQVEHDSYFHMTHRGLRALFERHGFEVEVLEPMPASGYLMMSQRLFGGDGQLHFDSLRAFARSSLLCGASLVPFCLAHLAEGARRAAGIDQTRNCAGFHFVVRKTTACRG